MGRVRAAAWAGGGSPHPAIFNTLSIATFNKIYYPVPTVLVLLGRGFALDAHVRCIRARACAGAVRLVTRARCVRTLGVPAPFFFCF